MNSRLTRLRCRQADVWLAAHEADSLGAAERIRLQEHLECCPDCRLRASGIGVLVQMLRKGTPQLGDARAQALWGSIRAGQRPSAPATRPGLARWLWTAGSAFAGASAVVLVAGALGQLSVAGPAATGPREDSPPPRALSGVGLSGFTLAESAGTEALVGRRLAVGQRVASGAGGAVLRGPGETVTLGPNTVVTLPRRAARPLRLERGRLRIVTRAGGRSHLAVRLGPLVVRPLGTAYQLRWPARRGFHVAVVVGRVHVTGGRRVVDVAAGQGLRWGSAPLPLSGKQARGLALALGVKMAAPVATAARLGSAVAAPRRVGRTLPRQTLPRRTFPRQTLSKQRARTVLPRREGTAPAATRRRQLAEIERLLLAGRSEAARQRARKLLGSSGDRCVLHTLIAESYVRERRYGAARDAYLAAHKSGPQTSLGADALYNAGSLELEQLRRPALARTRFTRYLGENKRGRQREGAYYMLVKALGRTGAAALAARVVARYQKEFPRGRYSAAMKRR